MKEGRKPEYPEKPPDGELQGSDEGCSDIVGHQGGNNDGGLFIC